MNSKPNAFYKAQKQTHQKAAKSFYKKMTSISILRLIVFLLTSFGIYISFFDWQITVGIGGVGAAIFLILLSKYSKLKRLYIIEKALVAINEEELKISVENFHHRPNGDEFKNPNHFYCLDIDLFGKGSFFQCINRTVLKEGTETLAKLLLHNNTQNIELRQEAINELAQKPKWRQRYSAIAGLIHVETPARVITAWLQNYKAFLPKGFTWLPTVFLSVSIALITLAVFQFLTPDFAGYWLLLGLLVTGVYLKKTNDLASKTNSLKDTFRQYALLLKEIENAHFVSEVLKEKQAKITLEGKKASVIFSELSKHLDSLDNRNNLISAIFGNGLFLLDLKHVFALEKWLKLYRFKVADWFEVVTFFDAYNSLGNYVFNYPEFVFPELSNGKTVINATQLGHPLLDVEKRIPSTVSINKDAFFIVTGANMAGKSTFLRTVALHIVMANVGLPVCATKSVYTPIKLITSMRTTDSLTEDSSYFFSELKRLKYIVDALKSSSYFIILDEILKGTNSKDKAMGSQKFVQKLVAANATGVIATHDLSLCILEDSLPQVKNYYFDAQIINNELYFDYLLKKGVCQNMNANFLLKKMEII